jgi:hypothetical protein
MLRYYFAYSAHRCQFEQENYSRYLTDVLSIVLLGRYAASQLLPPILLKQALMYHHLRLLAR